MPAEKIQRQNNESIVGLLKYGNFTMLLQEDAEAEEEAIYFEKRR